MLNEMMTNYKTARELAKRLRAEQKANPPTPDQVGAARAAMKAADTAAAVAADALLALAVERARQEAKGDSADDQWIIDLTLLTRDDTSVPTEPRCESLRLALVAGVPWSTWYELVWAVRLFRKSTASLPPGRFADLSRGKSWCRKGNGDAAERGTRHENGRNWVVGPGRWIVGSNDGFNRKEQTEWVVKHVTVGEGVWTVAS